MRPVRLLLANPNTNRATTEVMLAVARNLAPGGVAIEGATAPFWGEPLTDEAALARAAEAVGRLVTPERAAGFDGIVVAAFGDPGLASLRDALPAPVTGLAEAAMAEAAAQGPFAVVTTTPGLTAAIARSAAAYGHAKDFLGVGLTEGDPRSLMADEARLVAALEEACRSVLRLGARAIIIGGGPLALAARALKPLVPASIIEPIPAAVRLAAARLRPGR